MADKKSPNPNSPKSSKSTSSTSGKSSGVKKPTATLDLKATEVGRSDVPGTESRTASKPESASAKKPDTSKTKSSSTGAKTSGTSSSAGSKKAGPVASAASSSASSGGGFFSHLAASVVGGLLAIGGLIFGGEQLGLSIGGASPEDTQKSELRLASIEDQVKQLGQKTSQSAEAGGAVKTALDKINALQANVEQLATAQKTASEDATAIKGQLATQIADQAAVTNTARRLEAMEGRLKSIGEAAKAKGGDNVAELAKVTSQLNDIENSIAQKITSVRQSFNSQLAAQSQDLSSKLETGLSSSEPMETLRAGNQRLGVELETARADVDALKTELATLQKQLGEMQTSTTGSIASAVKPVTQQVTALAANVDGIIKREKLRDQKAQGVIVALELANLKRAMDRGEPFTEQLNSVKSASAGSIDLTAIEQLGGNTVPSRKKLIDGFDDVANKMIASSQPKTEGNILDRLVSNAKAIVRVRKTGLVEGDTTEAVAARMEVAIKSGKFAKAIEEAKALPPEVAQIAEPYLKQIRARMAVEKAMGKIEESLRSKIAPS